jgi:hypothetical protein
VSAGAREGVVDEVNEGHTTRTAQVLCPPGHYCTRGEKIPVSQCCVNGSLVGPLCAITVCYFDWGTL